MRQTWAILLDAYRALAAKKLFWIVLILSGLVVAAFGAVGINESGLTFFGWESDVGFTTAQLSPAVFYKTMFVSLGIGFWIAWLATILALVSTAGLIPDFLSDGSIDLTLSKPVGRLRLFLTKYASGLLFVALQVLVFCVASFLVLGLRGGTWEWGVFIAVPMVTIFFSYLYAICALLGVLTRSTMASLLLTLLLWFVIWGVQTTEQTLLFFRTMDQERIAVLQEDIERREGDLAQMSEQESAGIVEGLKNAVSRPSRERAMERRQEELERAEDRLATISRFHNGALAARTILPKTGETIGLIERWLIDLAELPDLSEEPEPILPPSDAPDGEEGEELEIDNAALQQRTQQRVVEKIRERSVLWIVGTSLLFEAFVLAIASWLFVRRDF